MCIRDKQPRFTTNGKRLSLQSIIFTLPQIATSQSTRKIEHNSHVSDKRKTTHLRVETENGKNWIFAVRGKNVLIIL